MTRHDLADLRAEHEAHLTAAALTTGCEACSAEGWLHAGHVDREPCRACWTVGRVPVEPPPDSDPPPSDADAPLWLQDEGEAPAITRLRREWLGELTRQTAWGGR